MKKILTIGLIGLVLSGVGISTAENTAADAIYLRSEMQSVQSVLSDNIDRFEHLQKMLENNGKSNKSYDEHKNIWMSTILAINAIESICEYENDLLTLFMDLKVFRRAHYFDLRTKSIDASIQQIAIMSEHIKTNHKLMPPDLAELHLYDKLKNNIDSSIEMLRKSKDLILQIRSQESARR